MFEQLVRETRSDLLAYALRRAASREDAADVLAETYLIAWRKLEKIPPGSNRACGCLASPPTCCAAALNDIDPARR